MSGLAKTNEFLLSSATIMIGTAADRTDLFVLSPEKHSLGLVKNITVNSETSETELTQGINNQPVASVNTSESTSIACEVYEYTKRNLAYAAQVDARSAGFDSFGAAGVFTTTTAIASGAAITTITLTATPTTGLIVAGDWICLQDSLILDHTVFAKVASITGAVITLDTSYAVPLAANTGFGAGSKVWKVTPLKIGQQARFTVAIKITGLLPETGEPISLLFPKAKITKGLALSFATDNFTGMPFEFKPYALTAADAFSAAGDIGIGKSYMIMKN